MLILRGIFMLLQVVDLSRPGLYTVQRVLGWHPLHVAAMSGAPRAAAGRCGLLYALLLCGIGSCGSMHPCCCCLTYLSQHICWRITRARTLLPSLHTRTAVLVAHCRSPGNIELIRRLVEQFNCDLRVKSMNSWTPLHYAAAYNQVRQLAAAVLCSACCTACVAVVVPHTAGRRACWRQLVALPLRLKLARLYLPGQCSSSLKRPVVGCPQVAAIEALISLGCEVVVQDAVGSTPLHVAAGEGHLGAISALVRLGCSSQGGRRGGRQSASWQLSNAARTLAFLP